MAVTPIVLYRGATSTTSGTVLYTAPLNNTVMSNIVVGNPTATAINFNLQLTMSGTGYSILGGTSVPANSTAFFDLKQVLSSGQQVTGNSTSTSVTFSISGVTAY